MIVHASAHRHRVGLALACALWLATTFLLVRAGADDLRLNSGPRADATVEAVHDVTRTQPESVTVTFTTASGGAARAVVETGFVHDAPHPGAHVEVAYEAQRPTHARLVGADDLTELAIVFGVATACLVVVARRARR